MVYGNDPDPRLDDRRILIAYGSETGNSQDSAEDLGRLAERLHFETWVCEMNDIDLVSCESFPSTPWPFSLLPSNAEQELYLPCCQPASLVSYHSNQRPTAYSPQPAARS